ncbi:hypothetical protein wcw_1463 [Waddlia chondrophila WSU 86-1044]|uniref:Uncharacterized protein n=1 Tax=Waddlia chondrophila (strain ATCC VR-1470 / WSU 86-1044) TaxID=716544 RepID=D6YRW7_WADCW|nr:hypothetical protein wcw_1463 [Waddlia chondrophila WSU 86-1044]
MANESGDTVINPYIAAARKKWQATKAILYTTGCLSKNDEIKQQFCSTKRLIDLENPVIPCM